MKNTKVIHLTIDFITVCIFVALDLFTKKLAVDNLKGKSPFVLIQNVFEFRYLENTGAAFSMMQNKRYIFLIITFIIMSVIVYVLYKLPLTKRYIYLEALLVLIFAGAVGNMYDRLINGYVVDFFYFSLIDFPIFNVADIYVSVATVLLAIFIIFYYKDHEFDFLLKDKKKQDEEI